MKNRLIYLLLSCFLMVSGFISAQSINWRSFSATQHHLIHLNTALDNGTNVGIGYGYKPNIRHNLLLNIEYSAPFGRNLVDDLKTKLGGQIEVAHISSFSATIKAYSIFRRYQSDLVTMVNFGSEFSAAAGWYRPKWYATMELGFDKAITTHIKHGAATREYFPEARDGWYIPTGGNFFYGIQSGVSIKKNDLYLRIGKTVTQDFKTTALLPYYLQLGVFRRF